MKNITNSELFYIDNISGAKKQCTCYSGDLNAQPIDIRAHSVETCYIGCCPAYIASAYAGFVYMEDDIVIEDTLCRAWLPTHSADNFA